MLTGGTRIGSYDVLDLLGRGGMGEVYRGRDIRLKRDVAIKVLPEEFARDVERLARFQREAEVLATLNHPNIAQIHGLEEFDGGQALVLELVEGHTLADVIAQRPLPLDEALPMARQIADALEAAHDHGIIHRDLKPANIKLTPEGRVKVLDFGLAKALDHDGMSPASGLSQSPTIASPALMTHANVILGTAAYMSPEQARGRPVDRRADIWAFGCVVYEMLTGRPSFAGDTVTDTLASLLKTEPEWTALPATTPEPILRMLRRCLAKDPRDRLSDAAVLRLEIDDARVWKPAAVQPAPLKPSSRAQIRLAWGIAAVSLLAAGAAAALFRPMPATSPSQVRFEIPPPAGLMFAAGERIAWNAVSPDGRYLAFTAIEPNGDASLWIRRLDVIELRRLASPATMPFWSPDSRAIAYVSAGNLMRADLSGGAPQLLGRAPGNLGGTWGADGTILIGGGRTGVRRMTGSGGEPADATTIDPSGKEISHRHPHFLPDGRHFLYTSYLERKVYVASLDGGPARAVADSDSQAQYSSGHLMLVRNGLLEAHPFDLQALKVSGEPIALARGMVSNAGLHAQFSASESGLLMYRPTAETDQFRIVWTGRDGKPIERPSIPDGEYRQLALSPDERYLSISRRMTNGSVNIWLADVARGVLSRFTSGEEVEDDFFWSPDSRRLGFSRGQRRIVEKSLAGGDERTLVSRPDVAYGEHYSPDGRFLAFGTGGTLFIQPLSPPGEPFRLAEEPASKDEPRFSPDSRWIAYYSLESGRPEVYAKLVSGGGERVRVSTEGGSQPRWRGDGREMFYLDLNGNIMAVPLRVSGSSLEPGIPVRLFQTPIQDVAVNIDQYDASADGQRFVMIASAPGGVQPPLTVVVNWTAAPHE